MAKWKDLSGSLRELLRLRTHPVALKFLPEAKDLEKIEKLRRPRHQVLFCQLVTAVRTFGMTMGAQDEDLLSPACSGMLGLSPRPDFVMDGRFKAAFWFESQTDGEQFERNFPVIPTGKHQAVALAPLGQERFEPAMILFYGTPAQMILAVNGLQWKDYEPLPFHCVGEGACADAIARCYLTRKPSLSIPSYGERTYGHVAEDELAMALPPEDFERMIKGLEGLAQRGIRYPIPYTGAIADMTPGIPKIYQEMLQDRKRRKP
jgi:uncharacterized protein (DUF169 family)